MRKNQTVYKRVARGGFVQLSNDLVRDKRLSFGARGLLAMVLSNADEWVANRAYFVNNTTDGANRVKTYFRELESLGYVKYELSGGGKGGFCNTWTFYDTPVAEIGAPLFPCSRFLAHGKTRARETSTTLEDQLSRIPIIQRIPI